MESMQVNMPEGLNPDTRELVKVFAEAMAAKLYKSQGKYGHTNKWKNDHWLYECSQALLEHLVKGDPVDVANYCAFMYHHGWSTSVRAVVVP
jgi:hypothetical protein